MAEHVPGTFSKHSHLPKVTKRSTQRSLRNLTFKHFVPKKNIIHERACYHCHVQREGETGENLK